MTMWEACQILRNEKLQHYNWFYGHDLRTEEVLICCRGKQWLVCTTDVRAVIVDGSCQYYSNESGALDEFIQRVRMNNAAPNQRSPLSRWLADRKWGRKWSRHMFYPVSKRARAAYLILCLEEACKVYCKNQAVTQLYWLLERLWEVTTTEDMEDWFDRTYALLPETVLEHKCCKSPEVHSQGQPETCLETYHYSLERLAYLQELYRSIGSQLDVLEELLDCICNVITADWGQNESNHTPSALQHIDWAEQILLEHAIPKPHDEQALTVLMKQRDGHNGKPFDGISLSSILSKR